MKKLFALMVVSAALVATGCNDAANDTTDTMPPPAETAPAEDAADEPAATEDAAAADDAATEG